MTREQRIDDLVRRHFDEGEMRDILARARLFESWRLDARADRLFDMTFATRTGWWNKARAVQRAFMHEAGR